MMLRVLLPALVLVASVRASAPDPLTLDDGYRQMYNLEFDAAHRTFQSWEHTHPDDAMGPVSDAAAYLFGEFERLHILQSEFFTHDERFTQGAKPTPSADARRKFEDALYNGGQIAARTLSRNPGDANARFAEILRKGLHADYLALIEKSYLSSLSEMKAGREQAEALIASHPEFKDAYLAVGVENYMLSLKPAPLRWALRMTGAQTDKEQGIRQLKLTAEGGRFLRPFARLLLAVAALRDRRTGEAKMLLAGLSKEFPRNRLYAEELARLR
jgi:hypothetical protein